MTNRPVGTVTFLFTDVEGSTRAWEAYPAETQTALKRHDEIVAGKIEAHNGALILERGEGDSVFAVFGRANDAVAAALEIQCALAVRMMRCSGVRDSVCAARTNVAA